MTDQSRLTSEAQTFLLDALSNLIDHDARLTAQDARIASLEAKLADLLAKPALPPIPVKAVLFEDDFKGTSLNLAKWDVKARGICTPSAVTVNDGLTITATKDSSGVWSSGEIQGLAPLSQYSGPHYSEARSKFPGGAGSWPAPFWERDAPWGSLGIENDVCEQLGKDPTKYHVTVHNGPNESFGKVVETGVDLSLDYHVYGCAMYADHADYYFDGRWMTSITKAEAGLSAWKFTTTPLVALIDLDMGGWGGAIDPALTVLRMQTSHIRVWAL